MARQAGFAGRISHKRTRKITKRINFTSYFAFLAFFRGYAFSGPIWPGCLSFARSRGLIFIFRRLD
jgi:hypothetical protein